LVRVAVGGPLGRRYGIEARCWPPAYGGVDDFAITPGDPALAALAAAALR
jgi:hypothetical protein